MMGRLIPSRSSSMFDPFAAEERENLRVVEAQAAVEELEAAEKAWLRLGYSKFTSAKLQRKPRQALM